MNPKRSRLWLWLVLLAGVVSFAPSFGNGFALDDVQVAASRSAAGKPLPMIRDSQSLGEFFGSHYWRDTSPSSDLYRPITKLSYAWTYHAIGKRIGNEALPHHAINVALHALAVWLVVRLLLVAGAAIHAALCGGLVFAVHAIHTEVVASVVGRAELFGFCFGAAACLLAVGAGGRILRLAGVSLLLFFAFCSKESAVAWAVFVPLFACVRDCSATARKGVVQCAVAAALPLLAFLVVRSSVLGALPPPEPVPFIANPLAHVSLLERVLTATTLWGYGLGKTLLPFGLSSDYGPAVVSIVDSVASPRFLASAVVLIACVAAGITFRRRAPLLFLAVASFFGFGFLTSNLALPIGTVFGERLYYTPSLGLAFVVATVAGVGSLRRVGLAALALWCLYNSGYSFYRSFVWKDSRSLASYDVVRQPRSVFLHRQMAGLKVAEGELDLAMRHLEEAVRLEPKYPGAWLLIGMLHQQRGDFASVAQAMRSGLDALQPGQRAMRMQLARNLMLASAMTGDFAQAVATQRRLLAELPAQPVEPAAPSVILDVATALARQGRTVEAAKLARLVAATGDLAPEVRQRAAALAAQIAK